MSDSEHQGVGHVVPLPLLFGVLGILLVLTVLTVAVTYVDLGHFNLLVAMLIAVVKASFVALYFMHLRWDRPFNSIVLISALCLVALFVFLALHQAVELSQGGVSVALVAEQPSLEHPNLEFVVRVLGEFLGGGLDYLERLLGLLLFAVGHQFLCEGELAEVGGEAIEFDHLVENLPGPLQVAVRVVRSGEHKPRLLGHRRVGGALQ